MTFSQENIADPKQIPHFYHTKVLFIEKSAYELNFSLFLFGCYGKKLLLCSENNKTTNFSYKTNKKTCNDNFV